MTTSPPDSTIPPTSSSISDLIANNFELPPKTIVTIPLDAIKRYEAACRGVEFDPASIAELYPNAKARRQHEMPTVKMPYSQARDIFRVLENLGEDLNISRLPETPIVNLEPLSLVDRIFDNWTYAAIQEQPQLDRVEHEELRSELRRVLSLIIEESHPDVQDIQTPRRRKGDSPISRPLLLDVVERIRDDEDQQAYVQIAELRDVDFKIAKAAVGALATLTRQHGSSVDLSGINELYRRGLLPLSLVIENEETIEAISKLIGRKPQEICEAIAKVEETHFQLRGTHLKNLADSYHSFVEALHSAQEQRNSSRIAETPPKPQPRVVNAPARTPKELDPELIEKAEDTLRHLVAKAAKLCADASRCSELFDREILQDVPDLPTTSELGDQVHDAKVRIEIKATNFWFKAAQASRRAMVFKAPVGEMIEAMSAIHPDDKPIRTFIYLSKARMADVFVEGVLVNTTARFLLEQPARNADFLEAVKQLENATNALEKYHANVVASLSEPAEIGKCAVNTDRFWRKLGFNPILQVDHSQEHGSIDITDPNVFDGRAREISYMFYHLPPSLAEPLFANQYGGLVWDLTNEFFDKRRDEISSVDPNGTIMETARSWRANFGTAGHDIVTAEYPISIRITDRESFAELFKPITDGYAPTLGDR